MTKTNRVFINKNLESCDERLKLIKDALEKDNHIKALDIAKKLAFDVDAILTELIRGSQDATNNWVIRRVELKVRRCIFIHKMVKEGIMYKDIGECLGLCGTRISQLNRQIPTISDHPLFQEYLRTGEIPNDSKISLKKEPYIVY